MADYYPLIARAVAGLDKNTGENRRALYERARTALVNQLRSVEPALNESDITRERLALEESIRKVEAEASRRARSDAGNGEEPQPSLRDHALRDFRDSVAEAQGLGDAAAQANRSARATYDAVPSDVPQAGEYDRAKSEPFFEPPADEAFEPRHEPHHEAQETHQGYQPQQPAEPPQFHDAPQSSEFAHEPAGEFPARDDAAWRAPPAAPYGDVEDEVTYARPARSYGRIVKIILLLLVIGGIAGGVYWQRQAISSMGKSVV